MWSQECERCGVDGSEVAGIELVLIEDKDHESGYTDEVWVCRPCLEKMMAGKG